MAKFWFWLVFIIFRYIIDQSDIICGQNGSRGQPRSFDLKLGVFGIIWGQNYNSFKAGQIVYKNKALDRTRGDPRSPDLK